jgi:sugar phosphate isomerase/epimerase
MKLGISNIAWKPEELDGALALMAEAGARGLEIAPGLAFAGEADPFKPSAAAVAALRSRLVAHDLELISMQSLLFGVLNAKLFGAPEERARFEAGLLRAVGLAETLGIANLVMGSPANRVIPPTVERARAEAEGAETFRRLGDAAAAAGTKLALEPNPATYGTNFMTTLREAFEFAALVDHPAVTVNFDLGALHMNGEFDQAPALFDLAAAKVSHVHVSEPNLAPAPADEAGFATAAAAILKRGYEGWFSIEMRATEQGRLDAVGRALEAAAHGLRRAEAAA